MRLPADRSAASSRTLPRMNALAAFAGSPQSKTNHPRAVPPPRLMLLTSKLGWGHLRTAQAIILAMRAKFPQAMISTLDFWSLMHSDIADVVHDIYLTIVQHHPALYDSMHSLDEHTWRQIFQSNEPPSQAVLNALQLILAICPQTLPSNARSDAYPRDRIVYPILRAALPGTSGGLKGSGGVLRLSVLRWVWWTLARRMTQHIQAFRPDVIVSTQMLPAALLSSLKLRRRWRLPSVGVLTDFGVHDFWIQRGTDHYCLAHEQVTDLRGSGLRSDAVSHTGVPLMPGFAAPPSAVEARHSLGLEVHRPIVLVLGGGLGLGTEALTTQLLSLPPPIQLVVMIGKNSTAETQLRRLSARHSDRLRILGWTDRMEYLMRAADIVVGKPGGLTVAEVLACGRPLFATRSLGGQEGFNLRFIEQHEVGKLVAEDALVDKIDSLLKAPRQLAMLQERAWSLGRRHGAQGVVEIVSRLAALTQPSMALRSV